MVKSKVWIYSRRNMPMHRKKKGERKGREKGKGKREKGKEETG